MPFFQTQSAIGADFNNTSTTALFALNTKLLGSGNTEWRYCQTSGQQITGNLVAIRIGGTCLPCTTLCLTSGQAASSPTAGGYDLGFVQGNWTDQDFGWVAIRGEVQVLCSGTIAPNNALHLGDTSVTARALTSATTCGSLLGILLSVSSSTAGLSLVTATVMWPRGVTTDFM